LRLVLAAGAAGWSDFSNGWQIPLLPERFP